MQTSNILRCTWVTKLISFFSTTKLVEQKDVTLNLFDIRGGIIWLLELL